MVEFFVSILGRRLVLYRRGDDSPEVARLNHGGYWERNGWRAEELPGAHMVPISAEDVGKQFPAAFKTEPGDN